MEGDFIGRILVIERDETDLEVFDEVMVNMKKIVGILLSAVLLFSLSACSDGQYNMSENETSSEQNETMQENIGENENTENQKTIEKVAMSPEDALKYMKQIDNLVIVDVATSDWYEQEHFEGAIHIPIEELSSSEADALYMKIPEGKPILVHCRLGMIAPDAYKRIIKLRPDIPEISYIDGKPPFKEYNEWLKKN